MPFAVLALGACLLMSRIARRRRPSASTDPRVIGLWPADRAGGPDPQRGDLARGSPGWSSAGARRRPPARSRLIATVAIVACSSSAVDVPRLGRCSAARCPARRCQRSVASTGFDIFAWNDPPTLSRYLAVGPARLLEMRVDGPHPQPVQGPAPAGLPISSSGCSRCRGRPAAGVRPVALLSCRPSSSPACSSRSRRRGAPSCTPRGRSSADHPVRPARARRRIARLGGAPGLDATGRLARAAARDLRLGALLGRAPADLRGGVA